MKRNSIARILSWLGFLIAVVCAIGLVVAGALAFQGTRDPTQHVGFAFLIVTTWLLMLGGGALLIGGLSSAMATDAATNGQIWRSRLAWMIGLMALGVGLMFGVLF